MKKKKSPTFTKVDLFLILQSHNTKNSHFGREIFSLFYIFFFVKPLTNTSSSNINYSWATIDLNFWNWYSAELSDALETLLVPRNIKTYF